MFRRGSLNLPRDNGRYGVTKRFGDHVVSGNSFRHVGTCTAIDAGDLDNAVAQLVWRYSDGALTPRRCASFGLLNPSRPSASMISRAWNANQGNRFRVDQWHPDGVWIEQLTALYDAYAAEQFAHTNAKEQRRSAKRQPSAVLISRSRYWPILNGPEIGAGPSTGPSCL